jgi:hypothetical protein
MQQFFIIKYNYNNFLSGTVVKHCANLENKSNLVKTIDTGERIWLMNYELYPIIDHDPFLDWSYNINFQKIIPSDYYIIKNNNKLVKLLNINNKWTVLDLDDNKEIIIDNDNLIKANEY